MALSGHFVTNANLFFQKQYVFLRLLMIEANRRYTGIGKNVIWNQILTELKGWNSLGPVLLTDTINKVCHVGRGTNSSILGHHQQCYGLNVLNHTYFHPIKHPDRTVLFQSQSDLFWKSLFAGSYSVHFFGSNTSGRRGWLTGRHTAYDYLGQNYCPVIYSIQNNMNLWLK